VNWWDLIREVGDAFLLQHAVLASFAYLLLEEGGLPIPVPGDFLMLALGVRAREGSVVLWQVIAAMEAGTVLGSSLLYFVARRGGRGVVERCGPFIGIGAAQLDRAQTQLLRHGAFAVVLGRLLPGLRILTAIACGMFRVPYRVFLPAMSLGSLIYIVGYTALGYFAGPAVLGLFEALHLPLGLVGSGGPLLLILAVLILVRRGLPHPLPRPALRTWQRTRVGLLAGLLATLGALFALDLLVVVAGDLAWRVPDSLLANAAGQLAQALARDATGGVLWLVAPLVAGVGWGSVYAAWAESRLEGPDLVRGLLFAFVPYVVSGGLLAPLLVQVADVTHVAPVALFTEAVRQAFYGLILGLAYPVLRARHGPDRTFVLKERPCIHIPAHRSRVLPNGQRMLPAIHSRSSAPRPPSARG
jgi:membrane protein DedA with SNARE-associated domain